MLEVGLVLVGIVAMVVVPVILIVAGARRLSGRRSRFDPIFEGIVRAQGAGVYPHSLRGDVSLQVDEGESVSQSVDAIRHTPARSTRSRQSRRRRR